MTISEAPSSAALLTVEDVAARLQMTARHVRELVREDRLVAIRITDKTVRFRSEDVEAFLQSCKTRAGGRG